MNSNNSFDINSIFTYDDAKEYFKRYTKNNYLYLLKKIINVTK